MRMRKRPNLAPRMDNCAALVISDGVSSRGKWLTDYPGHSELWLELGCGKGRFTAETAANAPEALLIAIEKVPDAMIIAMERVQRQSLENVRFIDGDVSGLPLLFAPDEANRIYINFCDPWPKSRDAKYRLTAPAFLRRYCDVLRPGGQIHFKTDNLPLFNWSLEQFKTEAWELSELTNDLHQNGVNGVMTDYEAKFFAEGWKISRLVATKTSATLSSSAGEPPRLRNASLKDERGFFQNIDYRRAGEDV